MALFGGALHIMAPVVVTGLMGAYATLDSPLAALLKIGGEARLTLWLSIHQGNTTQTTELMVASVEYSGSAGVRYRNFHDELFVLVLYGQVLDNEPVAIQVSATLHAEGHSDYGKAFLNFNTFDDDGIRVPAVCIYLAPNMIL